MIVLSVLAVICVSTGIWLLVRRPIIETQRSETVEEIVEKIEFGTPTVIVNRDDFAVEGEEYEVFEDEEPEESEPTPIEPTPIEPLDPQDDVFTLPEKITLTAVGTISMDAIDMKLALWDDAGIVPLRYGAGIYKDSVLPGEKGNLVILGHRMKAYGSIFNRLGEVELGDEIKITMMDGTIYAYTTDRIVDELPPKELPEYMKQEGVEGAQITLITCTPTGVGSHRLLVIGHLVEKNYSTDSKDRMPDR